MTRPDSTRHLGGKPTSESKPLWKPTAKKKKKPKPPKVRKESHRDSPNAHTRVRYGKIIVHPATILYTLDEARAMIAEEDRLLLARALHLGNTRRHDDRRYNLKEDRSNSGRLRAPRKCISGLNWVSWLSFVPPDWEEQW